MTDAFLEFNRRFANWIHWCQMRDKYQSRTGSAEGNWRSPQVWDDRLPKPAWLLELNEPDAHTLNRCYVALRCVAPYQARVIRILYFKTHWRPSWQAQSLNCTSRDLAELAHKAKIHFHNLLTGIEQKALNTHVLHISSNYGETLQAA